MNEQPEPGNKQPDGQFSVAALLKLIVLLSVVLGVAAALNERVITSFVGGAVLGAFFAEHFATSKRLEFILLLGSPLLAGTIGMASAAVLESLSRGEFGRSAITLLTCLLIGLGPSVLAFLCVCIFTAIFHYATGIQLVKFQWNEDYHEQN